LEIRAREAARKLGEGPTVVRSSAQLEEIGDVLLKGLSQAVAVYKFRSSRQS
jgi:hypothetical protein